MEKGFRVYIYRWGLGDCTNNGITSEKRGLTQVTLIGEGVPQMYAPTDGAPAMWLRRTGSGHVHAVPEAPTGESRRMGFLTPTWWMFGGNFLYASDSRFAALNGGAPIAIHDRSEQQDGGGQ